MLRRLLLTLLLLPPMPALHAAAAFVGLDLPGSQLSALSRDGRTAAGNLVGATSGGFRWRAGLPVELLPGAVSARAISASGRYIAGSALDAAQREVAAYWDADGALHAMHGIAGATASGGVLGIAFGITDEPRIVGMAPTADSRSAAFSWRPPATPELLPVAEDGSARASGIASDGARAYGWAESARAPRHAVIWSGHAMQPIDAGPSSEVLGANRTGDILLGISRTHRTGSTRVWRWRAQGGLGVLTDAASAPAQLTASDDAGMLLAGSLGNGTERVAAVWTPTHGLQPLERFLHERHIAVPPGWALAAATAVCADGSCIGGWGQRAGQFNSFIVTLPPAADVMPIPPDRSHHHPATTLGEPTR